MSNKVEIRIKAKSQRKNLDIPKISKLIVSNIRALDVYKSADNVMIFYPKNDEIDLLDLLNDYKSFYLPRVENKNMQCCPYKNGDKLVKSKFNVLEPLSNCIDCQLIDIVLIPALAVDYNGYRIGYGGGYYDRFLQNISAKKIVVIPEELVLSACPNDTRDIPVDVIVTQKKASLLRG